LLFVLSDILSLELAHFLNFIQVNNEALLICMVNRDALPAKDSPMIRAIEVHDPLVVRLAQFILEALWIVFLIKVYLTKQRISFNDLVQNIYIER
jgi:hypothetical protein